MPADHTLPGAIDFLSETVHIFKTKFRQFVPFYVILAFGFAVYPFIDANASSGDTNPLIVLPLFALMWLLLSYGAAAVIIKLSDLTAADEEVFAKTNKRFMPFLAVNSAGGLLTAIGLILFLVPGLIAAVWYYLATCINLLEDAGFKKSFIRSKAYLQGDWAEVFWKLFIVNSVPYIVAWVSVFIFNTLISLLRLQGLSVLVIEGVEEVVFGVIKYAMLLISVYIAYRYIKKKKPQIASER